MENSLSSSLSATVVRIRLTVLRIGFKFRLATSRVRVPAPSRLLLALLAGAGVQAVHANPTGGRVVSGNVAIGPSRGGSLDIVQTSQKGVVDWQSFDVGAGEKVNFLQPGKTSSTLNRIVGGDASTIFGEIRATGQVFLINPNGILFAPGSSVNVGGLLASTLEMSNDDYLAGRYTLTGPGAGTVANAGTLRGDYVVLAGRQVDNAGRIFASDGGTVAMAAGSRVDLNLTGSEVLSVSVDGPTAAALVHAGGIVQADGGRVLVSAKAADALLSTVVNVDGLVQARSIGQRDGKIVLDGGSSGVVAVAGALDASGRHAGESGGTVKVLGEEVGLFGKASIDASGAAGGGVVRVGGDWHGAGADGDANARQVFAGAGTSIDANAIAAGQGGNVVLWSDDQTSILGRISARGGAAGGDGGAVETSSHGVLNAFARVDAGAPRGHGGRWLLDPNDITIVGGGATSGITEDGTTHVWSTTGAGTLLNSDLEASLAGNTNVTVLTSGSPLGASDGNITVDAAVHAPADSGSLTLAAQRDIAFTTNGSIAAAAGHGLNVNLFAGTDTAGANPGTLNGGKVTMTGAASIDTGVGGSLAVGSAGVATLGTLTVGRAGAGNGGNLSVAAAGDVTQNGDWNVANGATSVTTTAGDITLTRPGNAIVNFSARDGDLTAGKGKVSVTTATPIALGDIDRDATHAVAGFLLVDAQGAVTQLPGKHLLVGGITSVTTTAGNVSLDNAGNTIPVLAVRDADPSTGNVSVATTGSLLLGNVDGGAGSQLHGTLTLNAHDVAQAAGTSLQVNGASVGVAAGDVTLANAGNDIRGLTVTDTDVAAGNVAVATVGAIALGDIQKDATHAVAGNLVVTAHGNVTQAGATRLQVGGITSVTTDTGDVALANTGNVIGTLAVRDTDVLAGNVAVSTTSNLLLGNVDGGAGTPLHGALTLNANDLSQAGGTALRANAAALTVSSGDVALTNTGNDIRSLTVTATDTTAGHGNVAVTTAGGISLGDIFRDASHGIAGDLTVSAHGDVTQASGRRLLVDGNTRVVTDLGDIVLTNSGNAMASFAARDGDATPGKGNVSVATTGAIALGDIDRDATHAIAGSLTANAHGSVTQVAGKHLLVGGVTTATTDFGDISLVNTGNALGALAVRDTDTTTGNVSATTTGPLQLRDVDGGAGTPLHGTLTLNADGISQMAGTALRANGVALDVAAGDVTLVNAGNDIRGLAVTDTDGAAGNVTVATTGAIALGDIRKDASHAIAGNLVVTAHGNVTQAGATRLQVGGITSVTTDTGDVTLANAGNVVGVLAVRDTDAAAGNVAASTTGNLLLGNVDGGAGVSLHGTLTVQAQGLGQAGGTALRVNGAALTLSSGDLVLTNPGNDIRGLAVTDTDAAAGNVTVATSGAIVLGDVRKDASHAIAGNLSVAAHGDVTQAGGAKLQVAGSTTVTTSAGDITLANANSLAGTFSAHDAQATPGHGNVAVATAGALSLGDVDNGAGGRLNGRLTANGVGVSQAAGTRLLVNDAALTTSSGDIVLTNAGNDIRGLSAVDTDAAPAAGNVTVATAGAIALGDVQQDATHAIAGDLSVTAHGDVTQVAGKKLLVGGATTVATSAGDITLDKANFLVGTVTAHDAETAVGHGNVSVATTGALSLGDVDDGSGGQLRGTLAANGAGVAQAAGTRLLVDAAALTTSSGDIVLTNAGNDIRGLSVTDGDAAGNVSVATAGAIALGDIRRAPSTALAGNLAVDAGGAVTQQAGTRLLVAGVTGVDTTAGDIAIGGIDSRLGSFRASDATGHVSVATGGDLALDAVQAATLDARAAGSITQVAATGLQVSGATTAATSAGDITLANAGNQLGTFSAHHTGAGDVTVASAGALALGDVDAGGPGAIAGSLFASAGGDLTQASGARLLVGGAVTATASTGDIALTNAGNRVGGFSAHDTDPTVGHGRVALTTAGALSLGDVDAGAATATAGGLTVNAGGSVTQAAGTRLLVGGVAQVDTAVGNIAIGSADSHIGGLRASATDAGAGNVGVTTSGGVALDDVHAASLAVVTTGPVTQNAGTGVQAASLAVNAGAGDVALGGANAVGLFAGTTTGSLAFNDSQALVLGEVSVGAPGTHTGDFQVATSAGGLTQAPGTALTVQGASTLGAGGDIVLANARNDFVGGVSATGGSITLTDANDLRIDSFTATGNVALAALTGALDLATGDIDLGSTHDLSLTSAGPLTTGELHARDIRLDSAGGIALAHNLSAAGNLVMTNEGSAAAITQAATGSTLTVAGTTTVVGGTGAVSLVGDGGNALAGHVQAAGGSVDVSAAGGLDVQATAVGEATLSAGTGALSVQATTGGDLTARGLSVALGADTVGGRLDVAAAGGAVTQTGVQTVAGTSAISAGSGQVTLAGANDFGGAVTVAGGAVELNDVNALTAHLTTGQAKLTAAGLLSVDGTTTGKLTATGAGVSLGATQVGGGADLAVASGGDVTQTAAITVGGASTLDAGPHRIQLDQGNDFGGEVTAIGALVAIKDINALTVHLDAAGPATLEAGAGALTVDGSAAGTLTASGAGVGFGATTLTGAASDLEVTSTGAVGQTGDLHVDGRTTLSAAGQSVQLARAGNHFGGAVTVAGGDVALASDGGLTAHLADSGDTVLDAVDAAAVDGAAQGALTVRGSAVAFGATSVGGALDAAAGKGAITQSGDLAVTGASTLTAVGQAVTLDRAGNGFSGPVTATGAAVSLAAAGPLAAHLSSSGAATLASGGALVVDGSVGDKLTMTAASASFGSGATTVGGDLAVAVPAGSATPLAAGTAAVTQTGALSVAGLATLDAGGADISLDNAGNQFAGAVKATGRGVSLAAGSALDARVNASGDTTLISSDGLSAQGRFDGALNATGATVALGTAGAQRIGGALDVTATGGGARLGDVGAAGITAKVDGDLLLAGTLASSGDVALTAGTIQGVGGRGAFDVAAGRRVNVSATRGGIGHDTASPQLVKNADQQLTLLNATGTGGGGVFVDFQPGFTAWFGVTSKAQFQSVFFQDSSPALNSSTFACAGQECFNVLGQTTSLADSTIANILNSAQQDAADAAFGTENIDLAMRKGYVTTIGRVPPGIDEIAGDLGATSCDPRVTSAGTIQSASACSAEVPKERPKRNPPGGVQAPSI